MNAVTPLRTDPITPCEPRPARAVFSPEDFHLLRAAVAHYLETGPTSPDMPKYAHLFHRLGTATGQRRR